MSEAIITTGDDIDFLHQINKDGAPLSISGAAVVTSKIISVDRSIALSDEITASVSDQGADWPNGLVSLPYPSVITEATYANNVGKFIRGRALALVETQINDGGKKTTAFDTITIVKGNVA